MAPRISGGAAGIVLHPVLFMSVPLDGLRLPQGALTAATRVDTGYGAVWIADLPGAAEQSACVASHRAFDSIEVVCSAPVRALLSHRPGALTVSWVDQAPAGHQIMQPCR
ncbi:hypothetical protein [Collimonas humicola]|uniref:hypothetical protein n=1 Tax=Collimonas humicola TaxID=2825886 RepID=UPI001B8C8CEB|nr:hypothetical protein [Collimonas humicola]